MAFAARSAWELEDPPAVAPSHGIREATLGDVPRLVEMGARFLASTYAGSLTDNPVQMAHLAKHLITLETGLVLVAERSGRVVGMIGMLIFPHVLSGELCGGELFWWVDPEARGVGLRLLRRAETWAIDRGAVRLQMVAPTPDVGALYERLGYAFVETAYSRRVQR
jgi:GNAT superfamily N-acetyltransferase